MLGKANRLLRLAVGGQIAEDRDRVAGRLVVGRGERIFDAMRDPQPAMRIELEVHRLVDVGLGRNQLDFEAGRKFEFFLLLGRRQRIGRRHVAT